MGGSGQAVTGGRVQVAPQTARQKELPI